MLRVLPRGSQSVRYLLYHNVAVRDADVPYIISHGHDITDRILAEAEMKRAQLAAEASAVARQNFLANMSYEIRTPMNGVLGMAAQLAKTRLDPRQLRRAGNGANGIQHPRNGCRSVAAPGPASPRKRPSAGSNARRRGHALGHRRPPPAEPNHHQPSQQRLEIHQGRLHQSPERAGERNGRYPDLRFRVAGTGTGIAPAQQARIFGSFTQASADTSRYTGARTCCTACRKRGYSTGFTT